MKSRNMRTEGKRDFLLNSAVLLAIAATAWGILPGCGPIGPRSMLFLNIINVCGMLGFMWTLEKYSALISGLYEKAVVTILSAVYTLIIMCLVNLMLFSDVSRLIYDVLLACANSACLLGTDALFEYYRRRNYRQPRLLIIDTNPNNFQRMKRIKYGVLQKYDSWYEDVGGSTSEEFRVFINTQFPSFDAVCILNGLQPEEYQMAVNAATEQNKDLFIVPEMIDVGKTNAKIVCFDDILTLYMPKTEFSATELVIKRAIDILFSILGLIIVLIPMGLIAAAIKATSPGPVIYKQTRYTRGKREFEIYKFRTMVADAEKLSGPKFAEKDDPRITPIGKILRSVRLDELPQLLNILKGDMSIVGPRPERPVFVALFEKEVEHYDDRFKVKAGLTSLSHVYGRYSTYIHDRTYYDLFYITHYSLLLDFKIILLTTKIMFLKSAAEGEDEFKQKTVAGSRKEVSIK